MSETGSQSQPDDALVDLLIKQVTEGLSPAEQRALDALDSATATQYLRDFERASAAITLAATTSGEALPAALRARIEQQAGSYFASRGAAAPDAEQRNANIAADNIVEFKNRRTPAGTSPQSTSRSAAIAWFAAAACLMLAIVSWFHSPQPPTTPVAELPKVVPFVPPAAPRTPAQERAALMAKADTLKIVLGATKDPAAAGVTGDVVWDPVAQKGFIHFVGLVANDPRILQYQIWIFDGARDQRYPVDGGVFDVPANSAEVVIPIRAELPVRAAKAFAVTVEKPGGVVVSAREHVLALGAAG
jgi:hypothetical protein